jgi:hypothetical protein
MDDFVWILAICILTVILVWQFLVARHNRKSYGQIVITEAIDGKKTFSLEIDKNPDEIASMGFITFKVTKETPEDLDDLAN